MNLFKKILITVISLVLMAAAVYLMVISYQKQHALRPAAVEEEQKPPLAEPPIDSLIIPSPPADSLRAPAPPTQAAGESLHWQKLPKDSASSTTPISPPEIPIRSLLLPPKESCQLSSPCRAR